MDVLGLVDNVSMIDRYTTLHLGAPLLAALWFALRTRSVAFGVVFTAGIIGVWEPFEWWFGRAHGVELFVESPVNVVGDLLAGGLGILCGVLWARRRLRTDREERRARREHRPRADVDALAEAAEGGAGR